MLPINCMGFPYTLLLGIQLLGIVSTLSETLLGSSFGVPNVNKDFDYVVRWP